MATRGQKLAAAGGTALIAEPVLALAHQGAVGVIVGLALGAAAYAVADDVEHAVGKGRESLPTATKDHGKPSVAHRLFNGKSVRHGHDHQDAQASTAFADDDQLRAPRQKRTGTFLFSQVLEQFTPSLDRIYLGTLENGTMAFCRAEDLCHVALAGTTRGGKSSIIRMLASQLCSAGASVLILNPHHSRYIYDKKEDWTPFENSDESGRPYLLYPPMECRQYDIIEHYLRQVVEVKMPERQDRVANGYQAGRPFFLILDELPAIVKHVPGASGYLDELIRQGAKYNLFVISASQDFLVKTLKLDSGEARECYRTSYYVGGGAQTAKILLDTVVDQTTENTLGQGTVLLRNWQSVKRASVASVPLVDNDALYRLLGPSTYRPATLSKQDEDELVSYMVSGQGYEKRETPPAIPVAPRYHGHAAGRDAQWQRRAEREQRLRGASVAPVQAKSDERRIPAIEEVRAAFPDARPSKRDIQKRFDLTDYQAYKLYGQW